MSRNNRTLNDAATTDSSPRRRWLRIGPGLVIALAISALVGSQWIKTEMAARQGHSGPPIVERQIISSSLDEKLGPTPEVSFIVGRAGKLRVTDAQLARLRALQSEWNRYYGPRIAQANQAAAKTSEYLQTAQGNSRTPVAQVQDSAAPVIALSGEISGARRGYWNRATKILTSEQREALQKEREAVWAAKMKKLSQKTSRG